VKVKRGQQRRLDKQVSRKEELMTAIVLREIEMTTATTGNENDEIK
jgi:hypothetical protein